jgi:RNA recognition motif-containing protein
MTIYIGNLPFTTNTQAIQQLFEQYGAVQSVKLITDPATQRIKGYGFIEMEDADGQKAIDALNDLEFGGRNLKVNQAREKEERSQRFRRN